MGKTVDKLTKRIEDQRAYVDAKKSVAKNQADVEFLESIVLVLAELNERVQCLEREIGHSGAFINPNEATDLPTKII